MKINKLTMRYEAHPGSVMELSPGLTVLFGDNDQGKSSLGRALKWPVTNTPRGEEMIPWTGDKRAEVTVDTDKGTVTRAKAKGINEYLVNGETYKALGSNVPEEVTEVLNLDETNIQAQVDQYFLLTASPGVVAKRINEAAGIAESDAAIKYTNELIGEAKKETTKLKEEIKNHNLYLATHERMIEEATKVFNELSSTEEFITDTNAHLTKARSLSEQVKTSTQTLADFPEYDHILERIGEIDELERQVEKRNEFVRGAGNLSVQIHGVDLHRFGVLEQVDLQELEELDRVTDSLSMRVMNMTALRDHISSINLDIYRGLDEGTAKVNQLEELDKELNDDTKALHEAKRVSAALHLCDVEKFKVLEQVDLGRIEELDKDVVRLNGLKDLLVQAKESKNKLATQEQELSSMFSELTALGLVCKECGQLIEGV